ncbi:ABC-2 transporter permease [Fusibacter ferrireducens]|uniref:ABC-2 transporter permease n=1 Tax=Fusibacter ferrireducens TaxID=2785058 RepID=A0ABR9ZYL2_9FIRM|nr:ABC-2 transporter permease [Fusibacter ferrireducens]MBF4695253.1 ABC-2 transporter permease [Fusibacter ferrireducens]
MKSLILKDLYNIGHHSRSMLLMLLIFGVIFLPTNGLISYVIMCCVMCSMMIVTTFAFDENAKWTKYAVIMPVSKNQIVLSKFIVLLIFTVIGTLVGSIVGGIGGALIQVFDYARLEDWINLITTSGIGLVIAFFFGSIVIPLLYKYGAEKARVLSLVAFVLPVVACVGLYKVLLTLGFVFSDRLVFTGMMLSPVLVLIWSIFMYKISCKIFGQQEF